MNETLELTNPGVLIPLLRRHGFYTRKSLGQHFLISRAALEAIIAACALDDGLPVLEIGPGIGAVTRALAERGAAVTAVELDARAIAVLGETVGGFPAVAIVQGDILTLDVAALLGERSWTVVGNLPYYITTPIIARVLEHAAHIRRAVFMVQREVADRLAAAPGGKTYGALSVFVQVYAAVERVAKVPKGAFLPPPTVDSAVVRLTMRSEPLVPPALRESFFTLVHAAFGQRRKTLENALANAGILGGERAAVAAALRAAGIDPGRRGETLAIDEYLRLAEQVMAR
ncbi:MAG TPA: 16S rRNA (adenine(1518)-N(6)/adenine(1519)-N(6))-dimethyltransferase RsmA [Armatimonadota bacterium]|nr:16S rRNA (adenine(1518)-N(6)/adenine(1519)-N(6))-dimethyltransferase RsmA [Armatimonadota bacterium]